MVMESRGEDEADQAWSTGELVQVGNNRERERGQGDIQLSNELIQTFLNKKITKRTFLKYILIPW